MTAKPVSRLRSWAALVLGALVLLLAVAVIPLSLLAGQDLIGNTAELSIGVPMCAVGFLVARRQPRNPIGWLLLVVVAGILVSLDAGPYAWLVYRMGYRLPGGPAAAVLQGAYFPVLFVALPPVFLLFPDGVLPSPRWRRVLRCHGRRVHPHRHARPAGRRTATAPARLRGDVHHPGRGGPGDVPRREIVARAGQTINVPANAPHAFTNAGEAPVRLLCLCAPAGQEEFFTWSASRWPPGPSRRRPWMPRGRPRSSRNL
jgi:hypothetical protein